LVLTEEQASRLEPDVDAGTATYTGERIGISEPLIYYATDDNCSVFEASPCVLKIDINIVELRSRVEALQQLHGDAKRHLGGRPLNKEMWIKLTVAACCWLDAEGVPDDQARLMRHLKEVAMNEFNADPDDKGLRQVVREAIEGWSRHLATPS
jgi:hypothetical protein